MHGRWGRHAAGEWHWRCIPGAVKLTCNDQAGGIASLQIGLAGDNTAYGRDNRPPISHSPHAAGLLERLEEPGLQRAGPPDSQPAAACRGAGVWEKGESGFTPGAGDEGRVGRRRTAGGRGSRGGRSACPRAGPERRIYGLDPGARPLAAVRWPAGVGWGVGAPAGGNTAPAGPGRNEPPWQAARAQGAGRGPARRRGGHAGVMCEPGGADGWPPAGPAAPLRRRSGFGGF